MEKKLTKTQREVLEIIAEIGPAFMPRIAERRKIAASDPETHLWTMTARVIKNLDNAGLVESEPIGDTVAFGWVITEKGKEAIGRAK